MRKPWPAKKAVAAAAANQHMNCAFKSFSCTFPFVMCKCSYIVTESDPSKKNNTEILPSISSSSQGELNNSISTTPQSRVSILSSPRRSSQSGVVNEGRTVGSAVARKLLPQIKRGKLKRRVTIGSGQSTSSGSGGGDDVDEPDWPPFADEDYIVFCFEEDGAFHVVMEESPKTPNKKIQYGEDGSVNSACGDDQNKDIHVNHPRVIHRRDCLLPSKEAEVEQTKGSLRLQSDEKGAGEWLEKDTVTGNESSESMECRNGSIESSNSSQLDCEQHGANLEAGHPCSLFEILAGDEDETLIYRRDHSLPNKMIEEEEMYLSCKSQVGSSRRDDHGEVSDESCRSGALDAGDTQSDHDDYEEAAAVGLDPFDDSIHSHSSSSSFAFPVLELEWNGSPITWPKSGGLRIRKHKSHRVICLRCCRF